MLCHLNSDLGGLVVNFLDPPILRSGRSLHVVTLKIYPKYSICVSQLKLSHGLIAYHLQSKNTPQLESNV